MSARATGLRRRRSGFLHTGVSLFVLAVVVVAPGASEARSVKRSKVDEGNRQFAAKEYDGARKLYREALGDTVRLPKDSQGVLYNEGNALYMQERYKDAINRYQMAFSEDSTLTGQMLYNRANALAREGMLQEAVESYIQSLLYLPDDEQARHNLEMALRMLEQQEQQQQENQQGDGENSEQSEQERQEEENDPQNQQEQEGQQNENPEEQDEQGEDEEEGEDQQQPDSTQVPPPQADSTQVPLPQLSPEDMQKLSREDALRILQALEEQEKRLQAERRKAAFRRLKRSGKDW